MAPVDRPGVAPVPLAEGKPQTGGVGGPEQEVDAARHQAPRPYRHAVAPAPGRQQFTVGFVEIGTEEGRLPAVAPLGQATRDIGRHRKCERSYGRV